MAARGGRGPGPAGAIAARAAERLGGRLAHRGARRVFGMAGGEDRLPALAHSFVGEVATRDGAYPPGVGASSCEARRGLGARGVGTALHPGAAEPEDLRTAERGHLWQGLHQEANPHARLRPASRRSRESRARATRPGAVPESRRGGRESRGRRRPKGPGASGHGPPPREGARGATAECPGRSAGTHRADRGRSRPGRRGGRGGCWNEGSEPRSFS